MVSDCGWLLPWILLRLQLVGQRVLIYLLLQLRPETCHFLAQLLIDIIFTLFLDFILRRRHSEALILALRLASGVCLLLVLIYVVFDFIC